MPSVGGASGRARARPLDDGRRTARSRSRAPRAAARAATRRPPTATRRRARDAPALLGGRSSLSSVALTADARFAATARGQLGPALLGRVGVRRHDDRRRARRARLGARPAHGGGRRARRVAVHRRVGRPSSSGGSRRRGSSRTRCSSCTSTKPRHVAARRRRRERRHRRRGGRRVVLWDVRAGGAPVASFSLGEPVTSLCWSDGRAASAASCRLVAVRGHGRAVRARRAPRRDGLDRERGALRLRRRAARRRRRGRRVAHGVGLARGRQRAAGGRRQCRAEEGDGRGRTPAWRSALITAFITGAEAWLHSDVT